jgi:hypothetical protein
MSCERLKERVYRDVYGAGQEARVKTGTGKEEGTCCGRKDTRLTLVPTASSAKCPENTGCTSFVNFLHRGSWY